MAQQKNGIVSELRKLQPVILSYAASSGSLFAANLAQLLTFAILARYLGAHDFGMFISMMAVTSIAIHICGLGATECLVRRVAQDRSIYPAMLGHNLILILITGIVLIVLGMLILPIWIELSSNVAGNLIGIFLMLVSNIVFTRLILLVEQIYIAHSDFVSANLSVVGFALARTIAAALACLAFGVSDVVHWATWQFGSHLIVLILYFYLLDRMGRPKFRIVRNELRLGFLFATPFIFRAIRQNIDLLVLGMLMPASIVGSYGVTRRIIDSSALSIEAMNRLVYPRLAVACAHGIHNGSEQAKKVLMAALLIGVLTSVSIFIIAPYLPILFGHEYDTLTNFTRILCWSTIFVAVWAVSTDMLGASGHHGPRATILNTANIVGAPILAFATWMAPPLGTFVSIYLIEIGIAIASWWVVLHLIRHSRAAAEANNRTQNVQICVGG